MTTTTVASAAAPGLPTIKCIDGAVAEIGVLADLHDVTNEVLSEMHFWVPDGARNVQLDQVASRSSLQVE